MKLHTAICGAVSVSQVIAGGLGVQLAAQRGHGLVGGNALQVLIVGLAFVMVVQSVWPVLSNGHTNNLWLHFWAPVLLIATTMLIVAAFVEWWVLGAWLVPSLVFYMSVCLVYDTPSGRLQ